MKFDNPRNALKILKYVEVYEEIPNLKYHNITLINTNLLQPHMGLKVDDNYCEKQREFFVNYPDLVAGPGVFYTDFQY